MAVMGQQFAAGLRCPLLSSTSSVLAKAAPFFMGGCGRRAAAVTCAVASVPNSAAARERQELREMFEEAYERCRTAPTEGVSFTLEDFHNALDKYVFDSEIGTKIKGRYLQSIPMEHWLIFLQNLLHFYL